METTTRITIETFKTVTKAIAQSDNLEVMTQHLAQLLVAALDIKACAIYVLDLETRQLELLSSFGLSPRYLIKGPIHADKSIADNLQGKPIVVSDVGQSEKIQYPEQAKDEGVASIISVPIAFMNEIIGALRLYHHEIWKISNQDLESLQLLAENVGLAMSYTSLCNAIYSISEVVQAVGVGRCPHLWRSPEE